MTDEQLRIAVLEQELEAKNAIIVQLLAHNEVLKQIARSYTTGGRIAGVEKMIEGDHEG